MIRLNQQIEEDGQAIESFFCRQIRTLHPFNQDAMQFCAMLSKALFDQAAIKKHPDLMALAFWLRNAHVQDLHAKFSSYIHQGMLLVPRGVVFHIAPGNVETMFVYSWILSLLVGNANIVRLPSKESEELALLFDLISIALKSFPTINSTSALIRYGHEEEITASISSRCDVRVIWGGDETIKQIRTFPLKPQAKEIAFADRYAFSVISAEAFGLAPEDEKQRIARDFFNDVYWYDQGACSSPRTLFWLGDRDKVKQASSSFYEHLQHVIQEKKYSLSTGAALEKEAYIYNQALSLNFLNLQRCSNELTVIELAEFDPGCRQHCAGGLFYHIPISNLSTLEDVVSAKDQTMTYFGIESEALAGLVSALNGKGLDRIVPVGRALNFDYLWDGYNLLMEFTKYATYHL